MEFENIEKEKKVTKRYKEYYPIIHRPMSAAKL